MKTLQDYTDQAVDNYVQFLDEIEAELEEQCPRYALADADLRAEIVDEVDDAFDACGHVHTAVERVLRTSAYARTMLGLEAPPVSSLRELREMKEEARKAKVAD